MQSPQTPSFSSAEGWVGVPRTLDASPRFLFWELDYVMVAGVLLSIGIILSGAMVGCLTAAAGCMLWKRARAGGGVARAFALVYWHLPFDVFGRIPASARRHFIG